MNGGFIPKDLYVDVHDELEPERFDNGTWKARWSEPRKRKVLFCDVDSMGDVLTIDQYYDCDHACGRRIDILELQAIAGFETMVLESAELYRKVFGR